MSIPHLDDVELDALLAGEELAGERLEHIESCLHCRRRRDGFLAAVQAAAGADPDSEELARLRAGALGQWGAPLPHLWWRWAAAAAAVLILGLLPLLRHPGAQRGPVNTDAVFEEVDRVLARDPLASLASESLLEEVIPAGQQVGERSVS